MSEPAYRDSIGSVRELRPTEDLSLLQTYELRRVFEAETVASLGLIETRDSRAPESFRPISAPLAIEARDPAPALRDAIRPAAQTSNDRTAPVDAERAPLAATPTDQEIPRRDWLLGPKLSSPVAEAQPYGDDPVRMRELLHWFADGRAAAASVVVQRAAGDLLDVPSEARERSTRLRTVLALGRTT